MKNIRYIMECQDCGEEFTVQNICDLTQNDDDVVEIDICRVGGFSRTCPNCGKTYYIPNLEDYIESED